MLTLATGFVLDSNGNCSLRAAIMQANALPGSHTIVLQSGATYTLMLDTAAGDENNAAEDDLDITASHHHPRQRGNY
ncbi:MAG: hypothetical protein KatS3mg078_2282 [Deltaproteobacteria bacterium]|nr:MAG: hypothetical protein KatS3mg078_2282 [Deltaproteobacteria bacterium]